MNKNLEPAFAEYDNYLEHGIDSSFVQYHQILEYVNKLKLNHIFSVDELGKSVEGRSIYCIKFGAGSRKILIWSQMHGDEPTATGALLDILNYLTKNQSTDFVKLISANLTISIIPMLNPDGALNFTRENIIGIDINRDAQKQVTPESKIFWQYVDNFKPEFAFNMHNQNSYYSAGNGGNSSAISMLCPPADYDKTISETRIKSMQIIYGINSLLNTIIPGHIARYSDDYEPRAFGDKLIDKKVSSILIESGFFPGDSNNNFLRKLNFISLLSAFDQIISNSYLNINYKDYFAIPENERQLFDLILRNVFINYGNNEFKVDIGINRNKKYDKNESKFYTVSEICEIGDLSIYRGNEEIDLTGFYAESLSILAQSFNNPTNLINLGFDILIKKGIGYIIVSDLDYDKKYTNFPVNLADSIKKIDNSVSIGNFANFKLTKENRTEALVLNGYFISFADGIEINLQNVKNGIIIH